MMDFPVRVIRLLDVMGLDGASYRHVIDAVVGEAETLGAAFVDHDNSRSLHSTFVELGWCEGEEFGDAILGSLPTTCATKAQSELCYSSSRFFGAAYAVPTGCIT